MTTFFKTQDGRLRGLRIGGCFYSLNAVLTIIASGWRSQGWIAWLLLACGFFVLSSAEGASESKPFTWRSLSNLTGIGLAFLGLILLVYNIAQRVH